MRAINHAMTGALIGLTVSAPAIAVPVAILSHFICDIIPHYDDANQVDDRLQSKQFKYFLIADAVLCVGLVVMLGVTQPANWQLAALCAFLATSPDLLWINRFVKTNAGKVWKPSRFSRFADEIQWFARPIGGVVELAWFAGFSVLLVAYIIA